MCEHASERVSAIGLVLLILCCTAISVIAFLYLVDVQGAIRPPATTPQPPTSAELPPTAPVHSQVINKTAKLCDSCWAIVTGKVTSTDEITLAEIVAQGDGAWARDKLKPGVKAPAFRKD